MPIQIVKKDIFWMNKSCRISFAITQLDVSKRITSHLLSMLPNIFLLYFQMQGGKFQKREVQKSQGSTGKHKI